PHSASQRVVDDLMLLHAALSDEGRGNHVRRVVVAIPRQILDRYRSIRQRRPYQLFDLAGAHRHKTLSQLLPIMGRLAAPPSDPAAMTREHCAAHSAIWDNRHLLST